jgi:hypothetical protein
MATKIGVISDTHSQSVPELVLDKLATMDMVLHCGDFCERDDYDVFKSLPEFKAVFGNMDSADLRKTLPEDLTFSVEGFKFGMTHGSGPPAKVPERAVSYFNDTSYDVILFGHSHVPLNEYRADQLLFNPGSPTDLITAPFLSYGLLTVTKRGVKGQIIRC